MPAETPPDVSSPNMLNLSILNGVSAAMPILDTAGPFKARLTVERLIYPTS